MKKILSVILAVMLLLSAVPMSVAGATSQLTVIADTVNGTPGETVDVEIKLADNPGIVSMKLNIGYDSDVLELVNRSAGSNFSGSMNYGPTGNNPFVVNWIDAIHPNNVSNGLFATLSFKIKDTAVEGFTPITITYSQNDIFNSSFDSVAVAVVNGGVDITYCQHENTTTATENETVLDCTQNAGYDSVVYCDDCGAEVSRQTIITEQAPGHKFNANDICTVCGDPRFTEPTVYVKNVSGTPGEVVDVEVKLANNPGIVSMKLGIAYDADELELVGYDAGSNFDTRMSFGPTDNNPFTVNWVDSINPDVSADGVFATLRFKIKDTAAEGLTPITIIYDQDDVFNSRFDDVIFEIESGNVEVVYCQHTATTTVTENVTELTCTQNAGYDNVIYCDDCGAEVSRQTIITEQAPGHDFNEDNICNVCGDPRFTEPTIYVKGASGTPGEIVDVEIKLANNPGIISMKLGVGYDANALELVEYTKGSNYASTMSFGPINNNPFVINWIDAVKPNVDVDGVFATLRFRVKETAAEGFTPITITYNQQDVFNSNWDDVVFEIESGNVEVVYCKHESTKVEIENNVLPTCTEKGSYDEVVYCVDCGRALSRTNITVKAIGHDYKTTRENVVEATCTAEGSCDEVSVCENCGDTYTNHIVLPMLEHTPGEVVIENNVLPTCTEKGSYDEVVYCDVCNTQISRNQVEVSALGHTPGEPTKDQVVSGNCTTKASYDEVICCTDCNQEISREHVVGAYGHILDKDGKCSVCNKIVGEPMFYVVSTTANVGKTFTVEVKVKNNPGIVSLKLALEYDTSLFELVDAKGDGVFTSVAFGPKETPFYINWVDSVNPDNTSDGVIATLTFKVKDDAPLGTSVISINYDPEDVFNAENNNVPFEKNSATVEIKDYTPGDINGDNVVNNKDLGLLMQYLNNWKVEINSDAADVTGDGAVNNKDYGLLMQYLNNWKVELK